MESLSQQQFTLLVAVYSDQGLAAKLADCLPGSWLERVSSDQRPKFRVNYCHFSCEATAAQVQPMLAARGFRSLVTTYE
jgi:hypothetical protein